MIDLKAAHEQIGHALAAYPAMRGKAYAVTVTRWSWPPNSFRPTETIEDRFTLYVDDDQAHPSQCLTVVRIGGTLEAAVEDFTHQLRQKWGRR